MIPRKVAIVAVLMILVLAGFLSTTLFSYFVARESVSRQIADETLPLTSDNIYSEIQRDLLTPILISSLMARDTFLRDWALAGEETASPISRYLGEIQDKYHTITTFFISDRTLRYYHPSGILKTIDRDAPGDSWYFRARAMNEPYEINVDHDTADRSRLSIFINYKVRDYEGDFIGITGVGLSVDSVVELVDTYQRRYGRRIYFVTREGDIALHSGAEPHQRTLKDIPGLDNHVTQILTSPGTAFTYTPPGGEEVHLNSRLVPEFNWFLIVEQRDSPGEAKIENTLIINILISIAVSLVVLVLAYFTIRDYQRRLEEMATSDKLTGAASRQVFDTLFQRSARTAERRAYPLCVLVIDIDYFKAVNDNYGHQGGDAVLRGLSLLLRRLLRESDVICRWGGEEFLILLDDCSLDCANQKAEQVREAVAAQPVHFGREEIKVTVSIGVARYLPGESMDSLIHRADTALYAAKRGGRNRVYGESSGS